MTRSSVEARFLDFRVPRTVVVSRFAAGSALPRALRIRTLILRARVEFSNGRFPLSGVPTATP